MVFLDCWIIRQVATHLYFHILMCGKLESFKLHLLHKEGITQKKSKTCGLPPIMGLIVDTHISLFYKGSTKRFCGLYRFKAPFGGDEESALSGKLLNMVGA